VGSLRTVAVVGGGRMGEAVVAGLVRAGLPPASLRVVEPDPGRCRYLADAYGVECRPLADVAPWAQVLVIAVKPKEAVPVAAAAATGMASDAVIVSLAAGVALAELQSATAAAGAIACIRVMPNTPALVGAGMSALSPGANCRPEQTALATELLSVLGRVVEVPEEQQDAVTAVSGSGPAYLFYVAEAMIDAGVLMGLPRPLATELATQTILGSGQMLRAAGAHPTILRENVTSPGGTTAAAVKVLDDRGAKAAFVAAMLACRDRSAGRTS
jgi:pyrroline-5-carboxylate reductase